MWHLFLTVLGASEVTRIMNVKQLCNNKNLDVYSIKLSIPLYFCKSLLQSFTYKYFCHHYQAFSVQMAFVHQVSDGCQLHQILYMLSQLLVRVSQLSCFIFVAQSPCARGHDLLCDPVRVGKRSEDSSRCPSLWAIVCSSVARRGDERSKCAKREVLMRSL